MPTDALSVLDWRSVEGPDRPPDHRVVVLVKGTTGNRAPKDRFVALAFYDAAWHPA